MNTTLTRTITVTGAILAIFAISTFALAGMAGASELGAIDPRCQSAGDYPVLIGSGYECPGASLAAPVSSVAESPAASASTSVNPKLQWSVLDGSGYEGWTTPAPVVVHGARSR